jgi:hypothetical protein
MPLLCSYCCWHLHHTPFKHPCHHHAAIAAGIYTTHPCHHYAAIAAGIYITHPCHHYAATAAGIYITHPCHHYAAIAAGIYMCCGQSIRHPCRRLLCSRTLWRSPAASPRFLVLCARHSRARAPRDTHPHQRGAGHSWPAPALHTLLISTNTARTTAAHWGH